MRFARTLGTAAAFAALLAACSAPPAPFDPTAGGSAFARGVESFLVVDPNGSGLTCEIVFDVQLALHDRDVVRYVGHTEVRGALPGCTFANWQFHAWLTCLPPASPVPAANTCGLQDLPISFLEQTSLDYRLTANPHGNVLRVEMNAFLVGYSARWAYGYDDTDPMICTVARCVFATPSLN